MDLSKLSKQQLADFIVENQHLLEKMPEDDLIKIQETLNPYSQVAEGDQKFTVLSITNFKADYWRAFKSLSMLRFLAQVASEAKDWAEAAGVPQEQREQFANHISIFKKHFFEFNPDKDCRDSKHTGADITTPAADFFHRWQRYEDQNSQHIHKDVQSAYLYRPKYQAAIQVYDTFATEEEAQAYVQRHSSTTGVDMLIGKTNHWLIIQNDEQSLEKTFFTDDEDQLLTGLLEQMRKDAKLGEDMIKKRVDHKKAESEKINGPIPEEAKNILNHKNSTYRQDRLEMGEIPDGQSVDVPIIMSGPEEISKHVI